ERIDGALPNGRLRLDVDDGWSDVVRNGDDRRAPRRAYGGRDRRPILPRLTRVDRLRFRRRLAGECDEKEDDDKAELLHAGDDTNGSRRRFPIARIKSAVRP